MKKIVVAFLALFALVAGSSLPAHAFGGGGHSGGGHFGGGHFGASGGHVESSGHFGGGHFGGARGGGNFGRGHFEGGHFRGHGHGGVDFVFEPFGPWWWDGYPYGYPNYYPSPVVLQSEPETYAVPPAPEQQFWYYCSDPSGYYPYVNRCAKGWLKVVPTPTDSGPQP